MELVRAKTKEDYKKIKKLYLEAFPKCERAPFFFIKHRAIKNRADCWKIEEKGDFLGLAYVIRNKELAYLFFFAIKKEKRGQKLGTKALSLIKEKYKEQKLFLALEDWNEPCNNKEERLKRLDFYKKSGLMELPYKLQEVTMFYAVMGTKKDIGVKDFRILTKEYLGPFISKFIVMRIIEK